MPKFLSKKAIILFTVFVDVLGMGIVIPILPYYVKSFGVSDFTVTLLFSVFAACSFVSAPLLGAWSDRLGRRPILIASIISTAIGWIVFAEASSIWILFVGRIIDGLAAGNISTAQSYLSDLSKTDKERTANLGSIGAIVGMAFIVGPLIGGLLSTYSHAIPFWFVGIMAGVNALLAYFFLPESHTEKHVGKIDINPISPIVRGLRNANLRSDFLVWFIFGIAITAHQSVFALFLDKVFGFGAVISGISMTGVGVVLTINQGFLLKSVWLKYFKENQLEHGSIFILAISLFLMSIPWLGIFIAGIIGVAFAQSILRVVLTSKMVSKSDGRHGEVMGVSISIFSLSLIIGPIVGGALFGIQPYYPFLIGALLMVGTWFLSRHSYKKSITPDPTDIFPPASIS
ncbi:MAG: MFS transporter [Candidatus Magasanikbacteria bacterium]